MVMNGNDAEGREAETGQNDPTPAAEGELYDSQLDAVAGGRAMNSQSSAVKSHDETVSALKGSVG
jgi:hypothetical protein